MDELESAARWVIEDWESAMRAGDEGPSKPSLRELRKALKRLEEKEDDRSP